MVLKRRINYQWRLFIPLVALLWFIIATLVYYQYRREVEYKKEIITSQLTSINKRIITAYERNYNLKQFLEFIGQYYENTVYDDIMISVFDATGNVLYQVGLPIRQLTDDNEDVPEMRQLREQGEGYALRANLVYPDKMFFYAANKSADGCIYIHTAMPFTVSLSSALGTEPIMWFIIITLAVLVTLIAFFSTRYISRNVVLLRDFANRAATNRNFVAVSEFPHDELGDISRQIVRMYREKDRAMAKSEHEHQVALRATQEQARIKRQLTNNINHELKTPVGVIKGYIDTILSSPEMPEDMRNRFLVKAQENVERLCSLLNDVSTMTRLEESVNEIPTTEIDYHDLVYDVSNDLDVSHINGDMSFNFDIPFDCKIRGNYTLLTAMLYNLIRNSANYSHGTEIELKLVGEDDDFYKFSFADDGIGVDEEHMPHLFERFYRVDAGRTRKSVASGGTGLGLPIVKNTVTSLGGSISVSNGQLGGLEFVYTLPKNKPFKRSESENDSPGTGADGENM